MDTKQTQNILVPAIAIAALIAVAGLIIYLGNPDPKGTGQAGKAGDAGPAPTGTAEGMSDSLPPLDSPEWRITDGGLKIWDVKEGEGEPVKQRASVLAHYSGWTTDGKSFDSSVKRGEPTEFSLSGVIRGWTEGLPGMKPGGIRRLYIPWPLAYGEGGKPPTIPPKADLVFEVKLISSH